MFISVLFIICFFLFRETPHHYKSSDHQLWFSPSHSLLVASCCCIALCSGSAGCSGATMHSTETWRSDTGNKTTTKQQQNKNNCAAALILRTTFTREFFIHSTHAILQNICSIKRTTFLQHKSLSIFNELHFCQLEIHSSNQWALVVSHDILMQFEIVVFKMLRFTSC